MRQLADAMATLPACVTPQTAAALQATENLWRRVEADGLLTAAEVAGLLDLHPPGSEVVGGLWRTNQLIGVERRNQIRYPGFQFDCNARRVRPVIPALIAIAAANDLSHRDLLFWLFSRTTYFRDHGMPVEHLEPADELLEVARNSMGIVW